MAPLDQSHIIANPSCSFGASHQSPRP